MPGRPPSLGQMQARISPGASPGPRGHEWLSGLLLAPAGKPRCPERAPCRPFPHYFPTPTDLCERIWSGSFRASPERRGSGRCLQKWFEPARGNPNAEVARRFASPARSWARCPGLLAFPLLLPLLS